MSSVLKYKGLLELIKEKLAAGIEREKIKQLAFVEFPRLNSYDFSRYFLNAGGKKIDRNMRTERREYMAKLDKTLDNKKLIALMEEKFPTMSAGMFYADKLAVFGITRQGNKSIKRIYSKGLGTPTFGFKMRECICCHKQFKTPIDKNGGSLRHRCEPCNDKINKREDKNRFSSKIII